MVISSATRPSTIASTLPAVHAGGGGGEDPKAAVVGLGGLETQPTLAPLPLPPHPPMRAAVTVT
jgi:hypothetical protein